MTKRDWFVSAGVGIVLGIVGAIASLPKSIHSQSVNASNGIDVALALTLNSHTKWDTALGIARFTFYGPEGETQVYVDSFEVASPNKAHIESISLDGKGQNTAWISDGEMTYALDGASKTFESAVLPQFSQDFSDIPQQLSEVAADMVYHHPFAMVIPLPIRDYLYPQWFPQGGGNFILSGEEYVLDRKTWVVEREKGSEFVKAWVDQETGVILKYTQWTNGKSFLDVEFTRIKFDTPIETAAFSPAAEYKQAVEQ